MSNVNDVTMPVGETLPQPEVAVAAVGGSITVLQNVESRGSTTSIVVDVVARLVAPADGAPMVAPAGDALIRVHFGWISDASVVARKFPGPPGHRPAHPLKDVRCRTGFNTGAENVNVIVPRAVHAPAVAQPVPSVKKLTVGVAVVAGNVNMASVESSSPSVFVPAIDVAPDVDATSEMLLGQVIEPEVTAPENVLLVAAGTGASDHRLSLIEADAFAGGATI